MESKNIASEKNDFRKKIREIKRSVSEEVKMLKSENIFAKVKENEYFLKSKIVMMYWSLPDEVQTHEAVKNFASNKKIILPVVKGDVLELREFRSEADLSAENKLGIGEPVGNAFTNYEKIDLIIVPGLAFDKSNNRLGRGKAYYDKLLKHTTAYKIGVCFDFQFFKSIPHDENDVKMDEVIMA